MKPVFTEQVGDYKVNIYYGHEAGNPLKEFEYLGHCMDKNQFFQTWLPVYDNDMWCYMFSDRLTSDIWFRGFSSESQNYVWYVSHKEIQDEFGKVTKETVDRAKKVIEAQIEEYLYWCNGETYGYEIEDKFGDIVDSCYEFYGYKSCREYAQGEVEYLAARDKRQIDKAKSIANILNLKF